MDRSLASALETLAASTRAVEILSDATHDLVSHGEACFSYDLHYTVHAPTTDINIASCREPIRDASLGILREVCRAAAEISAGCVVVHPGFSPWLEYRERSFGLLCQSLSELAAIQEEHGVPVAVENMGSWEVCHFRDPGLIPLLRECGLSFCLDVGHAHLNGVLEEFIAAARPDHVHLHDNRGTGDDHLAPGCGSIDYARLLPLLPGDASWIVEVPGIEAWDESIRFMAGMR
jgi:sugar phosphate isomerase/epimerase